VTSERARPWWASDGPVEGGAARAEDPVVLHRAARRGTGGTSPAPWWSTAGGEEATSGAEEVGRAPGEEPGAAGSVTGEPAGERHTIDACGVCPWCTSLRLLQSTRPDLVEHLTEAARHLAAAARSLLEPPIPPADGPVRDDRARRSAEAPADPDPDRHDGARLRRIHLDPVAEPDRDDPGGTPS
jgi:hypothetical protein